LSSEVDKGGRSARSCAVGGAFGPAAQDGAPRVRKRKVVIHETAFPRKPALIEPDVEEIEARALGEHPPLTAFAIPRRVRYRRSRHHRRPYNLVGTELAQ
jgi:hypothetical protein